MPLIQLPHTAGCLVCGRDNPHGLMLNLFVDPETSSVHVGFTPAPEHIGFEGVVHGGILATVLDEAMVWSATWAAKRFCVCAELTTRFLKEAAVGRTLAIQAKIESRRSRLVTTSAEVRDAETNVIVATGSAKYVPVPHDRNRAFVATLLAPPLAEEAARILESAANTGN